MDLNVLAGKCHEYAETQGFWKSPGNDREGNPLDRNPLEVLALIMREVSEAIDEVCNGSPLGESVDNWVAMPGARKDFTVEQGHVGPRIRMNAGGSMEATDEVWEHLGYVRKPKGVPSELADAIIRILDACAAWGIDIERAIREKMEYNRTREFMHGKKY